MKKLTSKYANILQTLAVPSKSFVLAGKYVRGNAGNSGSSRTHFTREAHASPKCRLPDWKPFLELAKVAIRNTFVNTQFTDITSSKWCAALGFSQAMQPGLKSAIQ